MSNLCPEIPRQRVVIEFTTRSTPILLDGKFIDAFAKALTNYLGMSLVDNQKPIIWSPTKAEHPYSGITYLMPWKTSSLCIHTWDQLRFATIDIYTCKSFNIKKAVEYIKEWFDVENIIYKEMLSFVEEESNE